MEYKEQLLSIEWLAKKTKILVRDKYQCKHCKARNCILNVHHLYYIKDHFAWQYPHNALITLCDDCHKKWHEENVLEVRAKPWRKKKPFKPPKQKGVKTWYNCSKRKRKNDNCLGMLQTKEVKYRPRKKNSE